MTKKLHIKQIRSAIGRLESQKRTIRALGIKKMGHTVIHDDTPTLRGMVNAVNHLVKVDVVEEEDR